MPLIWCSISGHGYGHAAQVVPVLNECAKRVDGLKAILRTSVPAQFFERRLQLSSWDLSAVEQDIGCVQDGPLRIDIAETWVKHREFHAAWEGRVRQEQEAIKERAPALVLSDVSYLAVEAAYQARVPVVAMSNLSWDQVLLPLCDPALDDQAGILNQIRDAYANADLMLRLTPGLPMNAFKHVMEIGPIHQPTDPDPLAVRHAIGASADETIVLVGFGGIPLPSLPIDAMERMAGFRFIVPGQVPAGCRRVHADTSIPLSFPALLASVDLIMSKPGYSTIIEAVAHRKPVLYVRRYIFADEESLVQYLHRHGRGVELPEPDFAAGRWEAYLHALRNLPGPEQSEPCPNAAADAADVLKQYL